MESQKTGTKEPKCAVRAYYGPSASRKSSVFCLD